VRVLRLFLRAFGWLLTPFMAWAASFFGCVAGEVIAIRMNDPQQGLILSAVLGAIAGFVTLILWLRLLRRSPELQEALAVTPEGVPDTAAKILDEIEERTTEAAR
jgi:membrane associated rhomboid family serine protease